MVDAVNEYLRYNHVKDERNNLFSDMCWLLSQSHCYKGFNYFTVDGKHSGGRNEQFDHLELY